MWSFFFLVRDTWCFVTVENHCRLFWVLTHCLVSWCWYVYDANDLSGLTQRLICVFYLALIDLSICIASQDFRHDCQSAILKDVHSDVLCMSVWLGGIHILVLFVCLLYQCSFVWFDLRLGIALVCHLFSRAVWSWCLLCGYCLLVEICIISYDYFILLNTVQVGCICVNVWRNNLVHTSGR